jgi:rhodanese-related sulfurtransferase
VNTKRLVVVAVACFAMSRMLFGATPWPIPASDLQAGITSRSIPNDFILIDVRDSNEVATGIIASDYCKPYHMSWNSGQFNNKFNLLPKNVRIIIYCRSGSRSNQAAAKLLENGYDSVGSMTGGINTYQGTKVDSTNFKPLSKLPEPSYFGTSSTKSIKPGFRITVPAETRRQQFTLQGRVMRQTGTQQSAPVYILERIGDETSGKVNGIQRLIQER